MRSPDIDKGIMDDDQNLTKIFEQVCEVTVGRHVHSHLPITNMDMKTGCCTRVKQYTCGMT